MIAARFLDALLRELPMLISAAVLCFAIGLAHSVLGERYILSRLFRRASLPELFGGQAFTRNTLRFTWHLTTIAWWGFGLLLLFVNQPDLQFRQTFLLVTTTVFGVTGLVALVVSRGKHLSWIVFLAIAALSLSAEPAGV